MDAAVITLGLTILLSTSSAIWTISSPIDTSLDGLQQELKSDLGGLRRDVKSELGGLRREVKERPGAGGDAHIGRPAAVAGEAAD